MQTITTEWVSIEVGDGTKMEAYVARPAGDGPHPGLLVIQEIFGVNAHIRDIAERFAREGYVALAPDVFHRFKPRYEGTYDDVPASIALTSNLTPEGLMADLVAAQAHLRASPRTGGKKVGAIGYCMGGRLAFVTNAVTPLDAAVSYYGGGTQQHLDLADKQHGPMLFFWAGKDGYIPVEAHRAVIDAVRAAGKTFVDCEFANVDHGFFCDARSSYDASASAQAWPLTLAFLATHLGK
jgi:carboxymethylenebutenolidase